MRAAQQVIRLHEESNGRLPQHNADNAVAQIMQQANKAATAATTSNDNDTVSCTDAPTITNGNNTNGIAHIKPEPDLPKSISPADIMLSNSQHSNSSPRKRALSLKSSEQTDQVPQKIKKQPRNDIDLDDEAINSDLDDSDDDALRGDGSDEEDGDVQTVLCLYEKVTRTKNKWKCVLRDGIVSVNGRDFAFNKANGEFEW